MKVQLRISSLLTFALVSASALSAQQVKTDYDRNADFGHYKTYSWGTVRTKNPLWVDRIKTAVNAALTAKGWTQVESDADVSIMAMGITEEHQTLNTFYDNFGDGWDWHRGGGFGDDFGTSTTTEETYQVGTLVVDLFDTSTRKLIWRGSANETLSDKSAKNIKNLDRGVEKMFDHFPPQPRKGEV